MSFVGWFTRYSAVSCTNVHVPSKKQTSERNNCMMMESPMQKLARLFKNESGATAIEYGLIAALIAVAIIGAVGALGNSTAGTFNNIAGEIANPGATS